MFGPSSEDESENVCHELLCNNLHKYAKKKKLVPVGLEAYSTYSLYS